MHSLRTILSAAVVTTALGVTFVPIASAQEAKPSNPPEKTQPSENPESTTLSSQTTTGTFTVKSVDKSKRELSLVGDNGEIMMMKASPDVAIDKVAVGQRFNVAYYQEVALAIQKTGAPAPHISKDKLQHGGVTARQTTVTSKVVSVDTVGNTVTVQGPQGNQHTIHVIDPALQAQLSTLKPGQSMQLTYTEALAVSAEPTK